jgi:hypothetical protein
MNGPMSNTDASRINAAALLWFTRATYASHRAIMSDPEVLPESFDEWLAQAKAGERGLQAAGAVTIRVPFDPLAFTLFCASRRLNPNGKTRSEFAAVQARMRMTNKVATKARSKPR